jgi:hypothetical protein
MAQLPQEDLDHADALNQAGWRQGSVFRDTGDLNLPFTLAADEVLIVATQSCTVVSPRFNVDPHIEVIAARPVAKYNARTDQATGKDARKYSLPVALDGSTAFECDINRRAFIPRRRFVTLAPAATAAPDIARGLAAWLGRYYMRIALPDKFVERAKHRLWGLIKDALAAPYNGTPLHAQIEGIYIIWDPDAEIAGEAPYQAELLFLCRAEDASEELDRRLLDTLSPWENGAIVDGLIIKHIAQATATTFVSHLDGRARLSEWDHFSDFGHELRTALDR